MDGRDDGDWATVPGVSPSGAAGGGEVTTLEVDGEVFELRPDGRGGTHYDWVSGPNSGYGFTMSPTAESAAEHRDNVRGFLSMIDPATGYIGED